MKILGQIISTAVFGYAFLAVAGEAVADDTYPHAVLSDSPLAYYQFEEAVGATVAVDSSPNGNDSVFVGSRNIRKSFDFGYQESPGVNTNFGVSGSVGNAIELLNVDSEGWVQAACDTPAVEADCEEYKGGGYIQTGVDLDINYNGTGPLFGSTPIDWSVSISIKNDDIAIGPTTFGENIITQRQLGNFDVQILSTGNLGGDGAGSPENRIYSSRFGGGASNGPAATSSQATDTPYDVNTPETNAGNQLTYEGEWETIVLTFEAATNEMRWYSQGQLFKTDDLDDNGTPLFVSVDDSWFIGVNAFFNWQLYPSIQVDEFAVYDYRLSDERVLAQFNAIAAQPGFDADFDGDGDVDGADFLALQRGFGTLYDDTDMTNWKSEFGSVAAAAAVSAVPEPASLLLAGMMIASFAACRRRRPAVA